MTNDKISTIENNVLQAMLYDKSVLELGLRDLTSEHFEDHRHRAVFDSMATMSRKGTPVTAPLLVQHINDNNRLVLPQDREFVSVLAAESFTGSEGEHYVTQLRSVYQQRKVHEAADRIVQAFELVDGVMTAEDFESLMEDHHHRILAASIGSEAEYDSKQHLQAILMDQLESDGVGFFPGFQGLHDQIGNITPGKLYVICGYSNQGKSTLMANMFARMTMDSVPISMFSTEMGTDFFHRVVCVYASKAGRSIDYRKLERGIKLNDKEKKLYLASMSDFFAQPNWRANWRASLSPSQLFANMRLYYGEGTKLFMIDHGHRLLYRSNDKLQHIAETAIELKNFAKDNNVAVVIAYQPRKPEQASEFDLSIPPTDADIRGLSEVWNEMDVSLFPFRPWVALSGLGVKYDGDTPSVVRRRRDFEMLKAERSCKLDDENFYVQVGKRRTGGHGQWLHLPFDNITGTIAPWKQTVSLPGAMSQLGELEVMQ